MSLLKRLLLSVTVAIAIILIGTLSWSVIAARQYLDAQLQSEGDNAASALALALSQPSNQDPVTRELMMMALFDTGKFDAIALTGLDGERLFAREQPPRARYDGQAPRWFVQLLPLRSPRVVRAVSDGWRQVGQLSLAVGSGYAQDALWRSGTRIAFLVVAAGLAWALFVAGLLKWFRRVLHREVETQVLAIAGQASAAGQGAGPRAGVAVHPHVTELASVVSAIQATRERVRATVQEQGQRIESLQLELHRDPVTGLANRRYFINELHRVLGGGVAAGHLMLFRQRDLAALNARLGRAGTDAWLATVGRQVEAVLATAGQDAATQLARLNGSDFVVLIPQLPGPQAMVLVEQVCRALQALRVVLADGQGCRWACALTDYVPGSTVTDVLARLDQALVRAESAGHAEVEFLACDEGRTPDHVAGEGLWRQTLDRALATPGALSLRMQPLVCEGAGGRVHQQEASLMLRMHDDGAALDGALFLPMAVRSGLSADFDVQALRLGLGWLREHVDESLVVRVSLPSLAQPDFLSRMREVLAGAPREAALRLVLELDAYALQAHGEEVVEFAARVADGGASVALRRLDQSPMALASLHGLALRYVKLGGGFAERALASPGAHRLLVAMLETAHGLGVPVLVPARVSAEAAALLRGLGAYLAAQPD